MQFHLKAFLTASAIALGLASPLAQSQAAAPPSTLDAPAATAPAAPTDAQLRKFAATAKEVAVTIQSYEPKIQAAPDDASRQSVLQEADAKLVALVQSAGFTVEEYNRLNQAVQQDPALLQRMESLN